MKLSGEEDRYSRTDFRNFQAKFDGAQKKLMLLNPLIKKYGVTLDTRPHANFANVDAVLGCIDKKESQERFFLVNGCFCGKTNVIRFKVADEQWAVIEPFLPSERGRGCRPAPDNRRFFNGMMWILRSGAPWRDLPESFG